MTKSILKKWFGPIPVVDAKADLFIQPSRKDIQNGVPNDPKCCVFANACKRAMGANNVLFFKTYSYVDMLNNKGKRVIFRFQNPPDVQELITNFDKGSKPEMLRGFTLKAPLKSHTLSARKRYKESSNKKRHKDSPTNPFTRVTPVKGRYQRYLSA